MSNKAKAIKVDGNGQGGKAKLAAAPVVEAAAVEAMDPREAALRAEAAALFGQEGADAVGDEVSRGCGPWVALLEAAANVEKARSQMGNDAASLAEALWGVDLPYEPHAAADDPKLYVALRFLHAIRGFVAGMDGVEERANFTDIGHRACCVVERDE